MRQTNSNLLSMVNMLNDGEYHDGTSIGKKLKLTRSGVWKAIKKLQQYGIVIHSLKGKGYALSEPLILLDKKKIKPEIKNININLFESLPSTNDYLQNYDGNKIKICLAEQQTSGKGRLGRKWYSPFGQNIYFSIFYPFQKDISELSGLSLVVGLAVIKTLQHYSLPQSPLMKWPNDVVYENKKLAGNLIEVRAEANGSSHAVIGIGINVNMLLDDNHIDQSWISLRKITAQYINRNQLCVDLIQSLLLYLEKFSKSGLAFFQNEWSSVDSLLNQKISFLSGTQQLSGQAVGINHQGHLLLKLSDGIIKAFSSGDVSFVR